MKKNTLRLILGDQLNSKHSWFTTVNKEVIFVLMEVRTETDYAKHHIQKVLGIFAAMRHFADALTQLGHNVVYLKINDKNNRQNFIENCDAIIQKYNIQHFEYLLPDEYRVDEILKHYSRTLSISSSVNDTEHFYTSRAEFADFFIGKKSYLLESFYRYMRKKHNILIIDKDKPLHGKWNMDADNRAKLPKTHQIIAPLLMSNDLNDIYKEIQTANISYIGRVDAGNYTWPITRKQSLQVLHYFVKHALPLFGTYQDAMSTDNWAIYHSRVSFSLNIKILSPQEVIQAAIEAYFANTEAIAYNQLEGFVRQILGWREYMRGIYWSQMPNYANLNFFENKALLPDWYWTGNTKMNCMHHAIDQSLEHAYAHHIQRLMLLGNFALLIGVHPDYMDEWFLGIFIDAFEWVEITNTRGMSQYADGGIVGSKPYVSSATYVFKMSNYCDNCHYNKNVKIGEKACPFNSLYWNFYNKHEVKLSKNPRIGMMYNVWRKMKEDDKEALLAQAKAYMHDVNNL